MFRMQESGALRFVTIEAFSRTQLVRHAFSTRIGGVSTGEAASLNFGFNRKDTRENIEQNFRLLCDAIGADVQQTVLTRQVHGNRVQAVTAKERGRGLFRANDDGEMDALITDEPGLVLCTFHADCMPLFFLDPVCRAIGLAHSGWRGTLLDIAAQTIRAMTAQYGTDPANVLCGVGPSIGPCCFEVDADVAAQFEQGYGKQYIQMHAKPHVDLWSVVRIQLERCGVQPEHITMADVCTCCNTDTYYSYRGDAHRTGSMVAMLSLL